MKQLKLQVIVIFVLDQVLYSEEKVPEEISNIDHPKCFDIPNSSSSTLNTLTFKAQRDRTEYRNNTNLNETMGMCFLLVSVYFLSIISKQLEGRMLYYNIFFS